MGSSLFFPPTCSFVHTASMSIQAETSKQKNRIKKSLIQGTLPYRVIQKGKQRVPKFKLLESEQLQYLLRFCHLQTQKQSRGVVHGVFPFFPTHPSVQAVQLGKPAIPGHPNAPRKSPLIPSPQFALTLQLSVSVVSMQTSMLLHPGGLTKCA